MKHTYQLIEIIICKMARIHNKQKGEIKKSLLLDCFSPACVPFSLLSRLAKSLQKVCLHLISKLTIKQIIFPNSTHDQNKYNCMLLAVTLLVARPKFVVVLILLAAYTKWWTSAQTWSAEQVLTFPLPSKLLLLRFHPAP